MADWEKIKAEYLTTETTYRELAQKYGVNYATIGRKASKEDWQTQRQQQANKTLTKMLTADTKQKVDRAIRLKTVADKLLDRVEDLVAYDDHLTASAIKNLSDALKNIKEAQMIRTQEDIEEQKARIAKLQKEVQREDNHKEPIRVIIDDGLNEYSK